MCRDHKVLLFAFQIVVIVSSVTATGSIKAAIMKETGDLYKNKPDICNQEILKLYFETDVSPNEDIRQSCINITKPCCSKSNIQSYIQKTAGAKAALKQISDWMKAFYAQLNKLSKNVPETTQPTPEISILMDKMTNSPYMQAEVSQYLDYISMSLGGLACTICDAKHGADFNLKEGKLENIEVELGQCRQVMISNLKLFVVFKHLAAIAGQAVIAKKETETPFDFNIDDFGKQITADEAQYKQCVSKFEAEGGKQSAGADPTCLDLCKKNIYLTDFTLPYQFHKLANEIAKYLALIYNYPEQIPPNKDFPPTFTIFNFKDSISDFNLKVNNLGANFVENIMEPHISMLDPGADDINKPIIKKEAKNVEEQNEDSTTMLFIHVGIVLLIVGSLASFVYIKTT